MKTVYTAIAALACLAAAGAGLENEHVSISFGHKGEIASIRVKSTGRELVKKPVPFAVATLKDGKKAVPVGFRQTGDRLGWSFEGGGGLLLKVVPFDGGWTFESEKFTVKDAASVEYMRVVPVCSKYNGNYAHMLSDDEDAVCIRSYDIKLQMVSPGGQWGTKDGFLKPVKANEEFGFTGYRCGLAAGPRDKIQKMLQAMTLVAGVPYSKCCGAWCLGSPECRNSYIFSYYEGTNFDEWLNVLKLTGIGTLHFHLYYSSSGNYTNINRKKFPKGLESMKEVADAVHAAGYRVSLHTLSAMIAGPNPWTGPVASDGLLSVFKYTTLNDLAEGTTELLVKERPDDDMDTVVTYGSLGNYLRLGGEIVQYSGIRREPPYAFTGITRGAMGTKVYDHKAGETAHYLRSRYYGIYPDAESPLMDEIADRFAKVFNTIDADRVYFDGAEGIGPRYGLKGEYQIALMLNKMFSRLGNGKKPVQSESSCVNTYTWWLRANGGAIDGGKYALKVFDRQHIARAVKSRKSNLLEPQLGWWAPGPYTDETDYFMSHFAGVDGAMSLYGPVRDVNKGPLGMHWQTQITILGWYEHFRMAKAFSDETLEKYRDLDAETRLRQDERGDWQAEDVACLSHRFADAQDECWAAESPHAGPAEPDIRILGGLAPYGDPSAIPVADGSCAGKMRVETSSAKQVTADMACVSDPQRGECFRMRAVNASGASSNAWARARLDWSKDLKAFEPSDGVGFWVRGDGSGALLDIRLCQHKLHGFAPNDCLVRLDFSGWRYFEFLYLERDAYEYLRHIWPTKASYAIMGTHFTPAKVDTFEMVLAEIPVKKDKEVFLDTNADAEMAKSDGVDVMVSGVRALPRRELELSDASLTVNGRTCAIPFASMASGDRIALEEGVWTLRDAKGELRQKVRTGDSLQAAAGANKVSFSAKAVRGAPRADVKLIVPGMRRKALKPVSEWPAEWKRHGMFEAALPAEYCPAKGATEIPDLKMRPGERAQLEVQVVGDVSGGTLEFATKGGWTAVKVPDVSGGRRVKVPTSHVLEGVRAVRFSCANPDGANCRIELIKHYTDSPATDVAPEIAAKKTPTKWELLAERLGADMRANGFSAAEIESAKSRIADLGEKDVGAKGGNAK